MTDKSVVILHEDFLGAHRRLFHVLLYLFRQNIAIFGGEK